MSRRRSTPDRFPVYRRRLPPLDLFFRFFGRGLPERLDAGRPDDRFTPCLEPALDPPFGFPLDLGRPWDDGVDVEPESGVSSALARLFRVDPGFDPRVVDRRSSDCLDPVGSVSDLDRLNPVGSASDLDRLEPDLDREPDFERARDFEPAEPDREPPFDPGRSGSR